VQRKHGDRSLHRQRQPLVLDGLDRVLEARVVELHHVRSVYTLPRESPGEVDVHDVKPAGAKAEVERLHVDDHLVAHLRATYQRDIRDRLAPCGVGMRSVAVAANAGPVTRTGVEQLDREILLSGHGRIGFENDGAAQLQHHQ
jgi:hypothetical protein